MSLGKEQISFSCSMICISAERAAAHARRPGPMASLLLVTPASVWSRALCHGLTCVQLGPMTTPGVKDANSSVFPNARRGSSKYPVYCPQSRAVLYIMQYVKYCMLYLSGFSCLFLLWDLQRNSATSFCSEVYLPKGGPPH